MSKRKKKIEGKRNALRAIQLTERQEERRSKHEQEALEYKEKKRKEVMETLAYEDALPLYLNHECFACRMQMRSKNVLEELVCPLCLNSWTIEDLERLKANPNAVLVEETPEELARVKPTGRKFFRRFRE